MFSIPSPSSGHRSAKRPSRHENASNSPTRIWWLTSAPTAHTIGSWSRRIVNTGPKRRSCSSSSPSGSEMILRVCDKLGAVLPGGSFARRRTRRSRRTSSAMRRTSPHLHRRRLRSADRARRGEDLDARHRPERYRVTGVSGPLSRPQADDDDPDLAGHRCGEPHARLRPQRDARGAPGRRAAELASHRAHPSRDLAADPARAAQGEHPGPAPGPSSVARRRTPG